MGQNRVGQKLDYEIVGAYLPYIIFSYFSVATIQRIRKSVVQKTAHSRHS